MNKVLLGGVPNNSWREFRRPLVLCFDGAACTWHCNLAAGRARYPASCKDVHVGTIRGCFFFSVDAVLHRTFFCFWQASSCRDGLVISAVRVWEHALFFFVSPSTSADVFGQCGDASRFLCFFSCEEGFHSNVLKNLLMSLERPRKPSLKRLPKNPAQIVWCP